MPYRTLMAPAEPIQCTRLREACDRMRTYGGSISPERLISAYFLARGDLFVSFEKLTANESFEALTFIEAVTVQTLRYAFG